MADGVELRAAIDTETVRALQLANGGAAAGLMTILPTILGRPGFFGLAVGIVGGIVCGAVGLAFTIMHNRLRRKCSLQYEYHPSQRKPPCFANSPPLVRWCVRRMQSVPGEPCLCTRSVFYMWVSLSAFVCSGVSVAWGAYCTGHAVAALAAPPPPVEQSAHAVAKHGDLVSLYLDHAEPETSKAGPFAVCVFHFDVGPKRYRVEINASDAAGCPQSIWVGDRP